MPAWFHWLSIAFMFYAELVAPFFVFGPRVLRRIGFASLVLLQLLIMSTGNYGFFNLLAIVLCLSVLDDRDFRALGALVRRQGEVAQESEVLSKPQVPRLWSLPRRVAVGIVGGILVAVTGAQTIETVWPGVKVPIPIQVLAQAIEPLRSANSYGLFRVMTTERPEITVEGSDDGMSWKPYRFRWKPCELDRRPRFTTPHMPRLDWQMWFAALAGDCRVAAVVPPVRAAVARGIARGARPLARGPVPRSAAAIYPRPAVALFVHRAGLTRLVGQPGHRAVLPADRIAPIAGGPARRSGRTPGLAADRPLFDNSSRSNADNWDDLAPDFGWT